MKQKTSYYKKYRWEIIKPSYHKEEEYSFIKNGYLFHDFNEFVNFTNINDEEEFEI